VSEIEARIAEMWRSGRLLPRILLVLLAFAAIVVTGTVIYSFLLPVTG
jgi:hypothetical protein